MFKMRMWASLLKIHQRRFLFIKRFLFTKFITFGAYSSIVLGILVFGEQFLSWLFPNFFPWKLGDVPLNLYVTWLIIVLSRVGCSIAAYVTVLDNHIQRSGRWGIIVYLFLIGVPIYAGWSVVGNLPYFLSIIPMITIALVSTIATHVGYRKGKRVLRQLEAIKARVRTQQVSKVNRQRLVDREERRISDEEEKTHDAEWRLLLGEGKADDDSRILNLKKVQLISDRKKLEYELNKLEIDQSRYERLDEIYMSRRNLVSPSPKSDPLEKYGSDAGDE